MNAESRITGSIHHSSYSSFIIHHSSFINLSLDSNIQKIFHKAVQVPVRPKVKRLRAIRFGCAVGELQVRVSELQLPGSESALAISIAKQISLRSNGARIWFLFAGHQISELRHVPFRDDTRQIPPANAQIVAVLIGLIVLCADRRRPE